MDPIPAGNYYFLQEHLHTGPVFHGGTGNKDIEKVLLREGYKPILFPHHSSFSLRAKWLRFSFLLKTLAALPVNGVLIFQAPLYTRLHGILLKVIQRLRPGMQLVCFITDIDGIKDGREEVLQKEIRFYKRFSKFIVHNDTMKEWLLHRVPGATIGTIDFFDYLAEPYGIQRKKSEEIAFAGNLAKSGFLKKLRTVAGLRFHLYGESNNLELPSGSSYEGKFEPVSLPRHLKGSFGLIWDGDATTGLEGPLGEYARFISPHKLSLYLVAGMPVICHTRSAVAALAAKFGFGFAVDSLNDIAPAIDALSEDDYAAMQAATKVPGMRIAGGQCLVKALRELDLAPYKPRN